ncbi:MAG: aminotransferase class IV [Bacteroidota bacterium]|nr:aminotransferase class IV [Bacteroidota bacterium]
MKKLSGANRVEMGNIEIIFNFCEPDDQKPDLVILFIEQRYPSGEQYRDGAGAISYDAVRHAPHVKQINLEMRQKTTSTIAENKLYEVILVNPENYITEGSRSNVFFVKDETIITPPVEMILPGITRDKIFKICRDKNIIIQEENIPLNEIDHFDAAFISGTSPKILPLQFIDQVTFNASNQLMRKLMREYDKMIEDHIRSREKLFHQSGV